MLYFNYEELKFYSKNDKNGIIILLFSSYFKLKTKIATNSNSLVHKLYVNYIPASLFSLNCLIRSSKTGSNIYNNYRCINRQGYINNLAFIHKKISVEDKHDYIYLLSQRRISEHINYIPDYYVEPRFIKNPLILHKNKHIHFHLEEI